MASVSEATSPLILQSAWSSCRKYVSIVSLYLPVNLYGIANLSQNRRFLLALLSIFQPLGVVVCSGIAYGLIPKHSCTINLPSCYAPDLAGGATCCTKADNYGWRYLTFTLGGISLSVFLLRFVVFTFQESPKFLLGKGKDEDAIRVLHEVAKTNGRECNITIETFDALTNASSNDFSPTEEHISGTPTLELCRGFRLEKSRVAQKVKSEFSRVKILFSTPPLARLTILVWIIYAFDYWGFSIAGD